MKWGTLKPIAGLWLLTVLASTAGRAETVALWLFDEQAGVYPSSVLGDAGPGSYFLILGRGGEITEGRFGRALRVRAPEPFAPHFREDSSSLVRDGMKAPPAIEGRVMPPLTWNNAVFAAAFLNGDQHLRRAPFPHPTVTRLNLGNGDWTVECWLQIERAPTGAGVIFEIGTGPRGENDVLTRLALNARADGVELFNDSGAGKVELPFDSGALAQGRWHHLALVHRSGGLQLYLDGRAQGAARPVRMAALPEGEEDYFSLGRDARWERPLAGALDEVRFSDSADYTGNFVPASHATVRAAVEPRVTQPLLFAETSTGNAPLALGSRRHLFLDDALIEAQRDITFRVHPPRMEEAVLKGSGWISVVDAGPEEIRLYVNGPEDSVALYTSKDGVNFTAPDLGREVHGRRNIVIADPATVGMVMIDPNGSGDEKWKLISGLRDRGGVFVYTSADGLNWRRHTSASLPFWAGSAVNVFYDDQRGVYVIHNRTDYYELPDGHTDRKSLLTEVTDLLAPWPFRPVTKTETAAAEAAGVHTSAGDLDPWWLDNGPLAPGGFGLEYPVAFESDPRLDPPDTDVYNTRAQKYPWAEDAYVAFPLFFFHYHSGGPVQRQVLAHPDEGRGSGLVETQFAASRDGLHWKRYPRPAYVGIGVHEDYPVRRSYVGYGMVRRGREIWQYSYTRSSYHDPWGKSPAPDAIHRLVSRVDGFVSADAPYTGGEFVTKPFTFTGSRLVLNIDTDAAGYAQAGFVDEAGQPIAGFGVDDCVYINGDEIDYPVEWMSADGERTRDVSALAGKTVRLVMRLRGTSLFALQFKPNPDL
ncbi:MAG: LamG domain-containing protein [Cephaloticoccus sp.]|nr:LamG domain-containing protein [Cephaloticoccus sp.]